MLQNTSSAAVYDKLKLQTTAANWLNQAGLQHLRLYEPSTALLKPLPVDAPYCIGL